MVTIDSILFAKHPIQFSFARRAVLFYAVTLSQRKKARQFVHT